MVEPQTLKANLNGANLFSTLNSSLLAKVPVIILTIMGAPHRTKAGFDIVANKRARLPPPLAEVWG